MKENLLIFENECCRLAVDEKCIVQSLVIKATGEECLMQGEEIALFSVTQGRPFNNEVKLAHPNKRTVFQGNSLRKEGNRLIVGFEIIPYKAAVEVKIASSYIAFTLADFLVAPEDYGHLAMDTPPAAEFRLLQLPIKNRENFGEWLNVSWDEKAAVNVLAACPQALVDSQRRKGYRILSADARREMGLKGTSAVLIACPTPKLMDAIDQLEKDFDLPRGVESRRSGKLNTSVYWSGHITPENVQEHIRYAKMGGFKLMLLYYTCFFKYGKMYDVIGNYDYRPEYPNGVDDVKKMLDKIKAAGITPGLHFLHTHIGLKSRYATPVADHRLHLTRHFTLARPLDEEETTVYVEQNPQGAVMNERCRILQFGGELIHYTAYTTQPPYCFTGCKRGDWDTRVQAHPLGQIGGILDVSEYGAVSAYLDQESSLQEEVGQKLADLYNAGFEFVYFDGSEGTNAPFEYHVPNAQYRVLKLLKGAPLFCEGAAKAHFSWHFLSGGNAFDIFPPEIFKEKIAQFPCEEAPRMQKDFTRVNFGWWGYWVGGTQPDHLEYGTSRAAAWDCPATIQMNLEKLDAHPRTKDNLEVMRRWEDVRAKNWLTQAQKEMLKDTSQEHILLINEQGEYELVPYRQIDSCPGIRAFLMERGGLRQVVYWHENGKGTLLLPLDVQKVTVRDELDQEPLSLEEKEGHCLLPAEGRRYLISALPQEAICAAFQQARLFNG
ncbi:MAG: hypothetical protein E7329_10655 [Clostridiales bacterium]|nr:hypothetical protein [Clostridiales bacterium]